MPDEIKEYDAAGNLIHYRDSDGYEAWREYNGNGNEIHYLDSDGYEGWREYNENGNEIHRWDSDGYEAWCDYDEDGNRIHYRNSKGTSWYAAKGVVIIESENVAEISQQGLGIWKVGAVSK